MAFLERVKISAVLTVTLILVLSLFDMVLSLDIGGFLFSDWFIPIVFGIGLLVAPVIARRIPYK